MSRKYMICGAAVDAETYDKYAHQKFTVNGREMSLKGVEVYATSAEIAENMPEAAAEAQAIYNTIMQGITPATLKGGAYRRFVDELDTLLTESKTRYREIWDNWQLAEEEYTKTKADKSAPDAAKEIARLEALKAKEAYRNNYEALRTEHSAKAAAIRTVLEEYAQDIYRATPDRIDTASMELLNAGIMKLSDYKYMAEQHRSNPLMLQVIAKYANEHAAILAAAGNNAAAKEVRAFTYSLRDADDYSSIIKGFDSLASFAAQNINLGGRPDNAYDKFWAKQRDTLCEQYDSFLVQPHINNDAQTGGNE